MNYEAVAYAVACGEVAGEDLKERDGDCRVIRLNESGEDAVIIKLWNRPGWRGRIRRFTRTTPGKKEFRALSLLQRIGIKAPIPLALNDLKGAPFTEALFQEDLGRCIIGVMHIKNLIASGQDKDLEVFLNGVVGITEKMVNARMFDVDHTFVNIVATPAGRPARLDMELAVQTRWGVPTRMYGKMLGKLIASHAYAVQPDVMRTTQFAEQLVDALHPTWPVLKVAGQTVEMSMAQQYKTSGIETQVYLPWAYSR